MKHDSDDRAARRELTRAKAERGEVLNLSELALISGYSRGALATVRLPLICGKISLTDFHRVLRRRQDALDMVTGGCLAPIAGDDPSQSIEVIHSSENTLAARREAADMFYGRRIGGLRR